MHNSRDGHETAENLVFKVPPGLGAGCSVHFVPFHVSVSVVPTVALVTADPTAIQSSAAPQDTSLRKLFVVGGRTSAPRSVQVVPSHSSARAIRRWAPV